MITDGRMVFGVDYEGVVARKYHLGWCLANIFILLFVFPILHFRIRDVTLTPKRLYLLDSRLVILPTIF